MPFEPAISLSRALTDPELFGNVFAAPSFWTWRVVAKLIDGLPLTEEREIKLFELCTGRAYNRQARRAVRRLILLAGRRAGKDRFFSAVVIWRAALCADWRQYQSPGEGAVCILLGKDKKQAAILRNYCRGLLQQPALAREVLRDTDDAIEFRNGGSLEIATNNVGLIRGRSAIGIFGSECCQWTSDEHAASSDEEVVAAAVPAMSMCPDTGLLALGSSVYRKKGFMFRQYKKLFGNEDADADTLCWFAESEVMNTRLPAHVVERALAEDREKAGAEYLNRWRDDLSDFIPLDVVEACTDAHVYERRPDPTLNYQAFTDAAGGTGADSFALAISHKQFDTNGTTVLDALRERKPPFIPAQVIAEYAALLKAYRISSVQGDGYAGGFHADEWQRNGIRFVPCDKTTSESYLYALPMLLSGRARLLDNVILRNQLTGLERRVMSGGRENICHPNISNAHDDVACAACGALVAAGDRLGFNYAYSQWAGGDPAVSDLENWRRLNTWVYLNSGGTMRLW